jgi:hypothetical protein
MSKVAKCKFIKTTWGVKEFASPKNWDGLLSKFKQSGYDGIEVALIGFRFAGTDKSEYPRLRELIQKHDMSLICQIHTCDYPEAPSGNVKEHLHRVQEQVKEAKLLQPDLINSHSGRDAWSNEKSVEFFREALKIQRNENVDLVHETHRQRCFYSPWNTMSILEEVPDLKLNADLSHWVCTAERMFTNESDPEWDGILKEIACRTHLIHSRVGHPEGPQVNDPRAPENLIFLEQHEKWWNTIWQIQKSRLQTLYIEPEFGPAPYMQTLPFTLKPVADLEEITEWMLNRHKATSFK